jgi:hypothetical protein
MFIEIEVCISEFFTQKRTLKNCTSENFEKNGIKKF